MTNDLWLNLPVKDLAKSIHFFTRHALTNTA